MVDSSTIQERPSDESDIVGTCSVGDEQLSIIHLARLGKGASAEGSGHHSHV
jgi:hypothetical protein